MSEEALKDYEKWVENTNPIDEIKRSIDLYEHEKRFCKDKKYKKVQYYYKVEWLQGICRSFRRFKKEDKEEMEEFWNYLVGLAKTNNAKVEDLINF